MQSYYTGRYYKCAIEKDIILFESKHGADLAGNIFRLLEEINCSYKASYRLYLTCLPEKKNTITALLENYNIEGYKLVDPHSLEYFKLLATAKYLITDTSFTTRYIKKHGQIVVNTWHGTPLKMMGRDIADSAYSIGNIERNLLFSDYLIYPNEYMKEKMVSAYMLDGVFNGTILDEGYPRNAVFFDRQRGFRMKQTLGLQNKQVFVYMPTWRGTLVNKKNEKQIDILTRYLKHLDKKLTDNQVLMTKLHPFVGNDLDYSQFEHIIPMPATYEAYEVLNCADCLITDYSSVFYDFANTGRKIVLFIYDEKEYMAERGVYMPLKSLPFPKTYTIDALYEEMCSPKNYDDSRFMQYCCTYENPYAAKNIVRHILNHENICKEEKICDNQKENVLVFAGSLAKNGITTAVVNLFENIDLTKRRYYATFVEPAVKNDPMRVCQIPKGVRILPMSTKPQYTIGEAFALFLFYKLNLNTRLVNKMMDRLFKREIRRYFGGVQFNSVVQYEGYGKNMIHLFQRFMCKTSIFVHNNMQEELATKNNQHRNSLYNAYNKYNTVVPVTKDIVKSTVEISCRENNIMVVNNCHSYKGVKQRAMQPLVFDEDTQASCTIEQLKAILSSDCQKIINIGRFSAEKGHDMLIEAFGKYYENHNNAYLIIIGGYGNLYEQTISLANSSNAADNIIIIRSVKNPMPILKQCDLFVLSSRYEGLGLTVLEADTLGIPVISTEVCGPTGFIKDNGGYLVEPSTDGILSGMEAFAKGEVTAMNVDYEKYNLNAVAQFEKLLNK